MSFCTSCGKEIPQDANYCPYCGGGKVGENTRTNKMATSQKKRRSGIAVTAFWCGIVGLVLPALGIPYISIPLDLIGVVLGVIGRQHIKKDPTLGGKWEAAGGIVCGVIGLFFCILGFFILKWHGLL